MTPHEVDIIEELRLILIQDGDDSATLNEARMALSGWFSAYYPQTGGRPGGHAGLRLIKGGGRRSRSRQHPLLSSVEDVQ
jgi:hypothetical protein